MPHPLCAVCNKPIPIAKLGKIPRGNLHPTCKPISLMSYLTILTTRENDIVLDPFTGSGTTAISSILLQRRFIGFEREEEYWKIATERISTAQAQKKLGE